MSLGLSSRNASTSLHCTIGQISDICGHFEIQAMTYILSYCQEVRKMMEILREKLSAIEKALESHDSTVMVYHVSGQ